MSGERKIKVMGRYFVPEITYEKALVEIKLLKKRGYYKANDELLKKYRALQADNAKLKFMTPMEIK